VSGHSSVDLVGECSILVYVLRFLVYQLATRINYIYMGAELAVSYTQRLDAKGVSHFLL
jgi:hypothetical protein